MLKPSFAQFPASSPASSRPSSCRSRADVKWSPSLLYALAIVALAPANALAQHVHGVIELGVVVEGDTVAVSLNAPLSDVVGFEHAPQSDEQVELVQRAAAVLSDPDAMFGLAAAASCRSSGVSVDGPAYLAADAEHTGATSHDDDHHHDEDSDHHDHEESGDHDHGDEHDDHDDHHGDSDHHDHEDSGDHDHDHEEQHAEVNASYEWTCDVVSNLDALELRFIDGFAGVEEIEVQILTSSGARVLTAGRDTESVSLATD